MSILEEYLSTDSARSVAQPVQKPSLFRRYLELPLEAKISMGFQVLRGLFLRRKLDTRGWILAGPGVKINKVNGRILIEDLVTLSPAVQIAVVSRDPQKPAVLSIGYNTSIMDRTKINARTLVSIGKECNISWDCDILDNDFHAILDSHGNPGEVTKPVVIEDHVWIGCNAIILKGVTIGHDSVVAAGSVVIKDVPPYSLVGGNPACLIRSIGGWSRNPGTD